MNSKKKIGFVVDNEFSNDPRVTNEANLLFSNGFEVHVLCFNFGNHPNETEVINGIHVHRLTISRKTKNLLFGSFNTFPFYTNYWTKHIKAFIKLTKVTAIHVHDIYMVPAGAKATEKKIPLIADLHENFAEAVLNYKWTKKPIQNFLFKPKKWKTLEPSLLEMADFLIVLSESYKNELSSKYDFLQPKNLIVYPNVPNLNTLFDYPIHQPKDIDSENFNLLYFGVVAERRGILTCMKAMRTLRKSIPNCKLILIGPINKSEEVDLEELIDDAELKDVILHIPWLDIKHLPSYLLKADVCLSPIHKSKQHDIGIANKLFQYMAFAKPIVASNSVAQMEMIEQENCGLIFLSDDHLDLAEKVLWLHDNPKESEQLGMNGKKAAVSKYNHITQGKSLIDLYSITLE